MKYSVLFPLAILTISTRFASGAVDYPIPADFKLGAGTSAYQIEGAWDEAGKSPSIWDVFAHEDPSHMVDNGDVACDSYHKYLEDVEMVKYLGVYHYRFSLSWARLLPKGDLSVLNQDGADYYINLTRTLKENGIEPMVTLYHWDLPQVLQDMGGWLNPEMEYYFAEYAAYAYTILGGYVKYWATFNEPKQTCEGGYGSGGSAPGIVSEGIGSYQCAHNILKAHATAYRIYDEQFKPTYNGKVTIVVDNFWMEPASNSTEDIEAAERSMQFGLGWFTNPIYSSEGNYPQIMIDRIAARSALEGFNQSRLPVFTQEEIDYIRGTYDYFGLNSYSTNMVKWQEDVPIDTPAFWKDMSVTVYNDESWVIQEGTDWAVVPWGLRSLVNWIDKSYGHPEIIVTESGYSDRNGTLEDDNRINYYKEYLSSLLEAIYNDGVNVTGYTAWSLMDNLEWQSGFSIKFGLFHVDFDSPNRPRTVKKSADYYKQIIATKCLVETCQSL